MAKNTNAANTNDQAATGFLAQLSTLATAITDLSQVAVKRDPLINARTKFAAICDETVKLIKAAAEQGKFFKKLPTFLMLCGKVCCIYRFSKFNITP